MADVEGAAADVGATVPEENDHKSNDNGVSSSESRRKNKRKLVLEEEAAKARKRGVCYLSRIPPGMDPIKLRQILSQYGEINRIYLAPKNPAAQGPRKKAGGFHGELFSEGWVEFAKKGIAKKVALMLNGEAIGGKKRSSFFYDLWNIKYLSKFKWDDLTEEIATKRALREQKLALELTAAKKERDFYLSKVDQSRALTSIEERLKKKQKAQHVSGEQPQQEVQVPKVIRQIPQTKPVDDVVESRPKLSKHILAGVFGDGSS